MTTTLVRMSAATLSAFVGRRVCYCTPGGSWRSARGIAIYYAAGRFRLRVWTGRRYTLLDDPERIRLDTTAEAA